MPEEDNNALHNFGHYEEEEYTLKGQDIEEGQIDLVDKSSNIRIRASDILSG